MRWTLVALALLLPVTSIRAGSQEDAKRKAELAWAKRIVTDFFEVATGTYENGLTRVAEAPGLLTPELAQALHDHKDNWNVLYEIRYYESFQISAEELAPNGSEAIFTGILKGKESSRRFVLRVAKESENGKWGIRFLKLLPEKEGKEKGEKPQEKKPGTKSPAELPAVPVPAEKPSPDEGQAATFRSENFRVTAPSLGVAQQIAAAAERHRKEEALAWLGKELSPWSELCPIDVKLSTGSGGSCSFAFDRGQVLSQHMVLEGALDRLLNEALPHELTHVVFAHHFGRPVPRWADEGGAVLSEASSERVRQTKRVLEILKTPGRPISLGRLFGMREYPSDVTALYAQGYSVTQFLVEAKDRKTFLAFVSQGMEHGWDKAAKDHYGYASVEKLELAWLKKVLRAGPARRRRHRVR